MKLLNMRNVRTEKGITQSQLAERIGSRQPYMSAIERGMPASEDMAKMIADRLGCEIADLIEPTVTLRISEIPPRLLTALQK